MGKMMKKRKKESREQSVIVWLAASLNLIYKLAISTKSPGMVLASSSPAAAVIGRAAMRRRHKRNCIKWRLVAKMAGHKHHCSFLSFARLVPLFLFCFRCFFFSQLFLAIICKIKGIFAPKPQPHTNTDTHTHIATAPNMAIKSEIVNRKKRDKKSKRKAGRKEKKILLCRQ